jgi:hypothetical protein
VRLRLSAKRLKGRHICSPLNEIAQLSKQWAEWDVLASLANYRVVVQTLFKYLMVGSMQASDIPL